MDLLIKHLQDQKLHVEGLKVQDHRSCACICVPSLPLGSCGSWTSYLASPDLSCLF